MGSNLVIYYLIIQFFDYAMLDVDGCREWDLFFDGQTDTQTDPQTTDMWAFYNRYLNILFTNEVKQLKIIGCSFSTYSLHLY